MNHKEVLASNLKRLMEQKGVTPTQVCADIGIPVSTFSDWCTTKSYPRMQKLEALADYFGVPRTELTENLDDTIAGYMVDMFANVSDAPFVEVRQFSLEESKQYLTEIMKLCLNPEQLHEMKEYAEFIKQRDEKKKDKQA